MKRTIISFNKFNETDLASVMPDDMTFEIGKRLFCLIEPYDDVDNSLLMSIGSYIQSLDLY